MKNLPWNSRIINVFEHQKFKGSSQATRPILVNLSIDIEMQHSIHTKKRIIGLELGKMYSISNIFQYKIKYYYEQTLFEVEDECLR